MAPSLSFSITLSGSCASLRTQFRHHLSPEPTLAKEHPHFLQTVAALSSLCTHEWPPVATV